MWTSENATQPLIQQTFSYSLNTGGLLMRPAVAIVGAARLLIRDPRLHTREVFARTHEGRQVRANHPHAVQWSMYGALAVCANTLGILPPGLIRLFDELVSQHPYVLGNPEADMFTFADRMAHGMVLDLLYHGERTLEERGYTREQ